MTHKAFYYGHIKVMSSRYNVIIHLHDDILLLHNIGLSLGHFFSTISVTTCSGWGGDSTEMNRLVDEKTELKPDKWNPHTNCHLRSKLQHSKRT